GGSADGGIRGRGRGDDPGGGLLLTAGAHPPGRRAGRPLSRAAARRGLRAQRGARARSDPLRHSRMRYEFKLPDICEGLAAAEVGKWLVKVGDRVVEDQPVLEMMTDKAAVEIPAPGAGVVVEQRANEGDVVKIGAVLYVLDSDAAIGGMASAPEPAPEP